MAAAAMPQTLTMPILPNFLFVVLWIEWLFCGSIRYGMLQDQKKTQTIVLFNINT